VTFDNDTGGQPALPGAAGCFLAIIAPFSAKASRAVQSQLLFQARLDSLRAGRATLAIHPFHSPETQVGHDKLHATPNDHRSERMARGGARPVRRVASPAVG
jgi:hypothetical protein